MIREHEPTKLRHAQPTMRIVADDTVDHSHHAEPLDHAAQLMHGILPTAHSRRPTLGKPVDEQTMDGRRSCLFSTTVNWLIARQSSLAGFS